MPESLRPPTPSFVAAFCLAAAVLLGGPAALAETDPSESSGDDSEGSGDSASRDPEGSDGAGSGRDGDAAGPPPGEASPPDGEQGSDETFSSAESGSPTAEERPEGAEVDETAGAAASAPPEPPRALQAPAAAEAPEAARAPQAFPIGAEQGVRAALLRVDALQALLQVGESGGASDGAIFELAALRRSLEDALVELGRLQGRVDLVRWLEEQGLVVVPRAVLDLADEGSVVEFDVSEEDSSRSLAASELAPLLAGVKAAPFTDGKMQTLSEMLGARRLVSDQAAQIVELFSFSRDKVDALVFLYPRIVDSDRFESLLGSLKFASDRLAVRRELGLPGS